MKSRNRVAAHNLFPVSSEAAPVAFVLLVGPQASGKSILARTLSNELRRDGERVALIELDQIAEMALPTLPGRDTAARILGMVAGEWARADLTCVIAEGIARKDEVSIVLSHVPADVALVVVALTTPLEAALPRAEGDLTRGLSRDRDWLAARYQEWSEEIGRVSADALVNMGVLSVDQGVRQVRAAIDAARTVQR